MTEDLIQLQPDPIDVATLIATASDPQAGGIAVFLGVTRAEDNPAGRALIALDYEVYSGMAVRQMHDLAARTREQWPVLRLALVHRSGRVPVGTASVAIVVSTPHRAEAFAACQWLIDTLKSEVAIWKKEVWSDDTASWSKTPKT